jgi:hypothetical protein
MPISINGVRKLLDVAETSEDKGLTMTVKVTAYDNGIVAVNGQPMRVERDLGRGLLAAMEHTAAQLGEFHKLVDERRDSLQRCTGDPGEEG